jgi:hypothetical protein
MFCWWEAKSQKFYLQLMVNLITLYKDKAVQLQAWSGPEGSRKLRFPDFMTTAQDGGKVVSTGRLSLSPTAL